ncbi:unnamed protein product [Onchocerca flexuosa]|uniref:ER membrane protein complex subunit 3 n=1 Tax=Onchocerca flexuosa TaxID=387005 RepID=A0A183HMG9_9BILA|nr:unnamed protein product [Onchocerca flexuosa]
MTELLLDPAIRTWVFLPVILITFLVGVLRHYVALIFTSRKKLELKQVRDSQYLILSRLLRENGHFLPKASFNMRKNFLLNEENGYITKGMRQPSQMQNPMADPTMMTDMLKVHFIPILS